MKIAIASDHAGYELKEALKTAFAGRFEWIDLGAGSASVSVDYPDYGRAVAEAVAQGRAERGIVLCGSGIGISIAANRHPGIRAALCANSTMARLARAHNDANVLALGARLTGFEIAADCVEAFMTTAYDGGRHEGRVAKLATGF